MRVALAQIDPIVGDLKGNAELVIARCREAQAAGAELVVFPELVISGYPPEDLLLKDYFVAECARVVQQVAEAVPGVVALVGAPLWEDGRLFNAAAVIAGGRIAGWYRKILLPNYAVFDEKRYFAPGDRVLALDIDGIRVGLTICEDIWDDEGPVCTVAQSGSASLVINMSMSPYHTAKGREREEMLAGRARAIGSHICYVNGVGGQDELVFDGHSVVFDADGCLVARAAAVRGAVARRRSGRCSRGSWKAPFRANGRSRCWSCHRRGAALSCGGSVTRTVPRHQGRRHPAAEALRHA